MIQASQRKFLYPLTLLTYMVIYYNVYILIFIQMQGWCQTNPLPIGNFKWERNLRRFLSKDFVDSIDCHGDTGFMLKVIF